MWWELELSAYTLSYETAVPAFSYFGEETMLSHPSCICMARNSLILENYRAQSLEIVSYLLTSVCNTRQNQCD